MRCNLLIDAHRHLECLPDIGGHSPAIKNIFGAKGTG
jgi:hypothetical protein